jgi:hypothetical protein
LIFSMSFMSFMSLFWSFCRGRKREDRGVREASTATPSSGFGVPSSPENSGRRDGIFRLGDIWVLYVFYGFLYGNSGRYTWSTYTSCAHMLCTYAVHICSHICRSLIIFVHCTIMINNVLQLQYTNTSRYIVTSVHASIISHLYRYWHTDIQIHMTYMTQHNTR